MFLNVFAGFVKLGKSEKQRKLWPIFLKKIQVFEKERKKKYLHFASALFTKDMLRIVKGFAPWILFDCFKGKISISIGVPGGPLGFRRLIRVGILQRGIRATVLKML